LAAQTAIVGILDTVADGFELLRRPMQPDELVATVRRRTGLHDFGDVDFAEPLQGLLESCANEVGLGLMGRVVTRWDALRFLSKPAAATPGGTSGTDDVG